MSLAVANRYARALADVALDNKMGLEPAAALAQVRGFAAMVDESADLKSVLMSPAVPAARKRSVAARLGETLGVHPLVRNFLWVLIDHRRTSAIGEIAQTLEEVFDERLGRVRAQVTSAAELSGPDKLLLEAELRRTTGKEVRCDFQIDPALLGGVSVQIGSTIYDGSVRGQLAAVRARLSGH